MRLIRLVRLNALITVCCLSTTAFGLEIEGKWIQGGLLIGKVEPGEKVEFAGRKLRVDEDGLFAFGLGRDAESTADLVVVGVDGQRQTHTYTVEQRQYNIQRIEGVPQKTVNPPAEEIERINRESQLMRAARRKDLNRRDFLETIIWPVLGPITGVYGSQRVYNGQPRRPHLGVDVARPTGTPVVAPLPGVVSVAHENMFFNGGTLVLDHGHGVTSTFIHLNKVLVNEGEEISQGQTIAEIGTTGRSTGPHLDWRMNWFNHPLDPQILVGPMPDWQN